MAVLLLRICLASPLGLGSPVGADLFRVNRADLENSSKFLTVGWGFFFFFFLAARTQ